LGVLDGDERAVNKLDIDVEAGSGMDRIVVRPWWARKSVNIAVAVIGFFVLLFAFFLWTYASGRHNTTLRVPAGRVLVSNVELGTFNDLIPIRASVVPLNTVVLDAVEGGRIERILVEEGQRVEEGQLLIEFGNTNLQLQVIQQEAQLNQAISTLQQNEISLEESTASNERLLMEVAYNITRLEKSVNRREILSGKGALPLEEGDMVRDELAYYKRLYPIQAGITERQKVLRDRLLPTIHYQLEKSQQNLNIVRRKLDGLLVRAPVAGRVTQLNLKVGENLEPGSRLAEINAETGYKLVGEVDEYYLGRIAVGQAAEVTLNGNVVSVRVSRVYPQVKDGRFNVDMDIPSDMTAGLVPGQSTQGRIALGTSEKEKSIVLAVGAFLDTTGGDWVFVLDDSNEAYRRRIKIGRRTSEQLEILDGLHPGERVIMSAYTGYERVSRIVLTN
jgi:HlyD family secretion protein